MENKTDNLHERVTAELNRREDMMKGEKADKKDMEHIKSARKAVKKGGNKSYSKAVIEIALDKI